MPYAGTGLKPLIHLGSHGGHTGCMLPLQRVGAFVAAAGAPLGLGT